MRESRGAHTHNKNDDERRFKFGRPHQATHTHNKTTPPSTRHRTKQEESGQFLHMDAKSQIPMEPHSVAAFRDLLTACLEFAAFSERVGAETR